MTEADRVAFTQEFALMMVKYPGLVSNEVMVAGYLDELRPYSWAAVKWAMREAPSRSRDRNGQPTVPPPAPLIAEIARARQGVLDRRQQEIDVSRRLGEGNQRPGVRRCENHVAACARGRELEEKLRKAVLADAQHDGERWGRNFFRLMREIGIGEVKRPPKKTREECLARLAAESQARQQLQNARDSSVTAAYVDTCAETWEEL